jgi:hypothetical protein
MTLTLQELSNFVATSMQGRHNYKDYLLGMPGSMQDDYVEIIRKAGQEPSSPLCFLDIPIVWHPHLALLRRTIEWPSKQHT